MILWSIRTPREMDILDETGRLKTDGRKVAAADRHAYRWMADQLAGHTPRPPGCYYPLWGWYRWQGEKRPRPDLRVGWGERGERLCLVEIEIDDRLVLLSDYQTWHFVLNRLYLPANCRADEAFEARLCDAGIANRWPYPEPFHTEVIESWPHIFQWASFEAGFHDPPAEAMVQGVFWMLKREWVRKVRFFHSR